MPRKLTPEETKTVTDASFWMGQSSRDGNTDAFVTRLAKVVSDTHNPLPHGHKPGGNLSVLRRAKIRPIVYTTVRTESGDRFPIIPDLPWARFLSYRPGGVRWERAMAPLREMFEIMRALAGVTVDGDRMPVPRNNVALARRFRQHREAENICRHLRNVRRRDAREAGQTAPTNAIFVHASDDESDREGSPAAVTEEDGDGEVEEEEEVSRAVVLVADS